MNTSFVYYWTDLDKNMFYVGFHKGTPDDGYICSSKYVLEEYKLRPDRFLRTIIKFGTNEEMILLETSILKFVDAKRNPLYYNRTNGHNSFYHVTPHTLKSRQKMSNALIGRKPTPVSDETRRKLSELRKGKKLSEETKQKISIAKIGKTSWNKGISPTEETRHKQSISHLGHISTEETRQKLSEKSKGRIHTEDAKIKISIARKLQSPPMLGRKISEETRIKMRLAAKNRKSNKI